MNRWIMEKAPADHRRMFRILELYCPSGSSRQLKTLQFPLNSQAGVLKFWKGKMGDSEDGGGRQLGRRMVFVTVGTTLFDALVRAVDTEEVKQELSKRGYTHLLIQIGKGTYLPTKSEGQDGSLAVEYFTFSSSITDHLRSASLVISHAGSGSIFETLRLGKPLIVVVNEDLMDNHQSELAEELAERRHLYCASPQTLLQTIAEMNVESLLPYPAGDARPVAKLINRFLGFPDD